MTNCHLRIQGSFEDKEGYAVKQSTQPYTHKSLTREISYPDELRCNVFDPSGYYSDSPRTTHQTGGVRMELNEKQLEPCKSNK